MGKSAYIKLVQGAKQQEVTLNELKELLTMYIDRTTKSGEQLEWREYGEAAFPYSLEEKEEDKTKYLYLKGKDQLYNYLIFGLGADENGTNFVQIVLPDEDYRTVGDQNKGSEFAKYLGKYLKAELHLFNGRIIYNNPRK